MKLNPCRKCIVRPTCKNICENMKEYEEIFVCRCIGSITLLLLFIHIVVTWWAYGSFNKSGVLALSICIMIAAYVTTARFIYQDWEGFLEQQWIERLMVIFGGPWIFGGVFLYSVIEDYFYIQLFKYNYNIHPYTKDLVKNRKGKHEESTKEKTSSC